MDKIKAKRLKTGFLLPPMVQERTGASKYLKMLAFVRFSVNFPCGLCYFYDIMSS